MITRAQRDGRMAWLIVALGDAPGQDGARGDISSIWIEKAGACPPARSEVEMDNNEIIAEALILAQPSEVPSDRSS